MNHVSEATTWFNISAAQAADIKRALFILEVSAHTSEQAAQARALYQAFSEARKGNIPDGP